MKIPERLERILGVKLGMRDSAFAIHSVREYGVACYEAGLAAGRGRVGQSANKSFEDWWKHSTVSWSPLGAAREAWRTQQFEIEALKHDIEQYAAASTALAMQLGDEQPLAQPAQERSKDREEILKQWDYYRALIAAGNTSSGPRDWFESILDSLAERQPAQDFTQVEFTTCPTCGNDDILVPVAQQPAQAAAPEYTQEMGDAANRYHDSFKYAHPLPAQWRWSELFNAMLDAAP